MIYIFIDTNTYIKLLISKEDNGKFEWLKSLINEGLVRLIVPEIVLLELEKENRRAKETFDKELRILASKTKEMFKDRWSEVRNLDLKVVDLITNDITEKKNMWQENYDELIVYLKSKEVDFIEFTPHILCKAEKRKISGKVPCKDPERFTQDAYNFESILHYFKEIKNISDLDEIIFCTDDKKDFFDKKKEDRFYKLNRVLRPDLDNVKGVSSIKSLYNYLNIGHGRDILYDYDEESKNYYSAQINVDELTKKIVENKEYKPKSLYEYRQKLLEKIYEEYSQVVNKEGYEHIVDDSEYYIKGIFDIPTLMDLRANIKKIHTY